MKKFVTLLLILGLASVASAGTMVVSGLPASVDTSAGETVLSFDIVSNGQLDNDSLYVFATTGGTLDIASATNNVVADELYADDPDNHDFLGVYVDTTDVSHPVIWADIAIPKATPAVIVGDVISDLGLTIAQGALGTLDVSVLSENSGVVEGVASIELVVPEPVTIALLGLGGLFLRRRK